MHLACSSISGVKASPPVKSVFHIVHAQASAGIEDMPSFWFVIFVAIGMFAAHSHVVAGLQAFESLGVGVDVVATRGYTGHTSTPYFDACLRIRRHAIKSAEKFSAWLRNLEEEAMFQKRERTWTKHRVAKSMRSVWQSYRASGYIRDHSCEGEDSDDNSSSSSASPNRVLTKVNEWCAEWDPEWAAQMEEQEAQRLKWHEAEYSDGDSSSSSLQGLPALSFLKESSDEPQSD